MTDVPPPPPGFVMDGASAGATPPPPTGFVLDGQAPPAAGPRQRVGRDVPQYGRDAPSTAAQDVGNVVGRIAPKVNDRLAETVGRALDVVPYYAHKAYKAATGDPVTDEKTQSFHPVENAYKHYFGSEGLPPPQSGAQELADAGAGVIGETLPFTLGGAGLLSKLAKPAIDAAPTVANAFRDFGHRIGQSFVQKPVATLAGETVAAGESGAMGEAMRQHQVDEGRGPLAQKAGETLGQVSGPMILQATPAAIAARVAPAVARLGGRAIEATVKATGNAIPESYRPAWVDRLAKQGDEQRAEKATNAVASKLAPALERPEAKAGIAEVEKLQESVPGFNPGVARATNDPELLNTQQNLDANATGPKLREKQTGFDESKGAIANRLETLIPPAEAPRRAPDAVGPQPATRNPEDSAVGAAGRRVENLTGRIGAQRDAAEGQIRTMSEGLPQVDRIAGGDTMRNARAGAQQAMDAETTRLRGAIANPNQMLEVHPATADAPAVEMTVNQVLNRRASINQEMRDYTDATARTTGDVRAMRQLQQERDHLDGVVQAASENDGSLRAYTTHYATQNVPQFRQGASAEVGRRDQFGYGGNKVDPEQVGKKFFNPNEESAARQFNASMGHDPAARQQMIDNALDDIRHTAVDPNTGLLKEGAVAKWQQKHERVLREVPFVQEAVNARNPDALYARIGELEQRQRQVASTKLAKELQTIAGPGKNSSMAVDAALNDHVLMRQLVNSARGDPSALSAVRRSVFEAIQKKAPDAVDNPEKFLEVLKGHDRALSVALTPQHKADLQAIARAAQIQGRLGRPEGSAVVPKSIIGTIQDALGVTVGSAASTARGVAQGRTSLPIEMAAQGAKFANRQAKNASDAAWEEALSNPEAAKMVAAVVRGKPTIQQTQKLRAYLLASGAMHAEGRDNAPE